MKSAFLTLTLATSALLAAEPAEPAKPAPALQSAPSTAKVVDLRVESQTNPTAVNTPLPRFSWRIETEERGWLQKSYHILVASTPELLAQDKGDLWDSGEVSGRLSTLKFISIRRQPLLSPITDPTFGKSESRTGKESSPLGACLLRPPSSSPAPLPCPHLLFPPGILPAISRISIRATLSWTKSTKWEPDSCPRSTSLRDLSLAGRSAGYHRSLIPHGARLASALQRSVDINAGFYPHHTPLRW